MVSSIISGVVPTRTRAAPVTRPLGSPRSSVPLSVSDDVLVGGLGPESMAKSKMSIPVL